MFSKYFFSPNSLVLRELHISNLAVIFDARIEFAPGLNCFTGATGAGKSLVIGALELLLGLRGTTDMLRPGANEGRVSGVFEITANDLLQQIATATDVNVTTDGGEILLTRKLYPSGRSSISLNGQPITLGMLKQVAEHLVDVHGQHDHQYLLKSANQLDVIDQFGNLGDRRQKYQSIYEQLQTVRRRLHELTSSDSLRHQQLELYRFQAQEIDAAELDPAEYTELQSRASVLVNLEKLKKDAGAAHASLYEMDGSILERLKMMVAILADLLNLDTNLKDIATNIRDATIGLEECAFDLSRYLDKLDLDPGELTDVNDRLNTIHRLLNKYGDSVETALNYRRDIGQKIESLEQTTGDLATLQKQLDPLRKELKHLGDDLTTKRKAIAQKLSPLIENQLKELGMEKAKFTIALSPSPESSTGFDQVEFIVQTNPGQLPQPLRKIASGGELSRIMLALKGILAQSDRVSVLVFDEIDANVGGRLGSVIGEKLRRLAQHHQVLCITHLPQIASYADRHFTVRKEVIAGKTESHVHTVEAAERLEEIAEMIGGTHITQTTRAQAHELIESAKLQTAGASKPHPALKLTPPRAKKRQPSA